MSISSVSSNTSGFVASNNAQGQAKKEEKSFFDKLLDDVKTIFDDKKDIDTQFADEKKIKANKSATALDRLFLEAKDKEQKVKYKEMTYTITPVKDSQTLEEKWAKDNQEAKQKQQENEIKKLKEEISELKKEKKVAKDQPNKTAQNTPKESKEEVVKETKHEETKIKSSKPTNEIAKNEPKEPKEDIIDLTPKENNKMA